jgi:hypothetical protein
MEGCCHAKRTTTHADTMNGLDYYLPTLDAWPETDESGGHLRAQAFSELERERDTLKEELRRRKREDLENLTLRVEHQTLKKENGMLRTDCQSLHAGHIQSIELYHEHFTRYFETERPEGAQTDLERRTVRIMRGEMKILEQEIQRLSDIIRAYHQASDHMMEYFNHIRGLVKTQLKSAEEAAGLN